MSDPPETLEQIQARHRKEAKDLQGRITSKKKNATKKTRRGVNSECEELERALKERQSAEIAALNGTADGHESIPDDDEDNDEVDGAAERLGSLNVDELGAKPPQRGNTEPSTGKGIQEAGQNGVSSPEESQKQGGGGAAGAGKKRNRQKERLARRAAETEAAALAAEQEASTQTDHRAVEKTRMLAEFTKNSLVEHEIRPDGHCLFSAVADQLAQLGIDLDRREAGEPGYKTVRRHAAEYIGAHRDEYAGFLEEGVDSYVRKIRDTAEWGGQIELAAVANVWGVEVWVVQDGDTEVVKPSEQAVEGEEQAEKKRIWLAYYRHGYGLGEHYNSLRKKA
ncbi:OTU protein [Gnomoniopsis smithogilvyi]|uniref:OTU protein n=1 Tax=Gnomoniopsis smithogilvyi TaxID=1191159 RepID=A0A9W8Z250_9PEZI|nr:OTU protein [Gnomoniopsis smithogilvyi]